VGPRKDRRDERRATYMYRLLRKARTLTPSPASIPWRVAPQAVAPHATRWSRRRRIGGLSALRSSATPLYPSVEGPGVRARDIRSLVPHDPRFVLVRRKAEITGRHEDGKTESQFFPVNSFLRAFPSPCELPLLAVSGRELEAARDGSHAPARPLPSTHGCQTASRGDARENDSHEDSLGIPDHIAPRSARDHTGADHMGTDRMGADHMRDGVREDRTRVRSGSSAARA
jgi:hypothetical protein